MPKQKGYYAVKKGRRTGVFSSWDECKRQVEGFSGAQHKKFDSVAEAEAFVNGGGSFQSYTQPRPLYSKSAPYNKNDSKADQRKIQSDSQSVYSYNKVQKTISLESLYKNEPLEQSRLQDQDVFNSTNKVVYTDGASSSNGTKWARAGYGVYWGNNHPRNISNRLSGDRQTNQRAEATAVLEALKQAEYDSGTLEIRTDSQYVIKAVNEWSKKWVKQGWISSNGKKVENKDLFERILEARDKRQGETKLVYVAGHSGEPGNEKADSLAVLGATKAKSSLI